jgi:hypothetical protein
MMACVEGGRPLARSRFAYAPDAFIGIQLGCVAGEFADVQPGEALLQNGDRAPRGGSTPDPRAGSRGPAGGGARRGRSA